MNNKFFMLVWFSIFSLAVRAENLTLESAQFEAKANNPLLKKAISFNEISHWKKQEAKSTYVPHLNFKADHFFKNKYQIVETEFAGRVIDFPATYPLTTLTLEGSWLIFDGFAGWNSYKAASLESEAASLLLSRANFQLEEEIKLRFYQALAAQELAAVAIKNIQTLEDHHADIIRREKAGFSTQFDVLRIEVQLEDARTEKVASDDLVSITRTKLQQVMGLSEDDRPLDGKLLIPNDQTISQKLELAFSDRTDIVAQTKQQNASSYAFLASRAHWFPRVTLVANSQEYNNIDRSLGGTSNFKKAYAFGVNLNWNLFDGGASYSRQQQANFKEEESLHGLRAATLQAATDFQASKRKFYYTLSLYQAKLRSVKKGEESVRLALIGLKAGTITHMELLDAELDLMKGRAGVIKAQSEYIDALVSLELAAGKNIF